jgi:hypothetical protein
MPTIISTSVAAIFSAAIAIILEAFLAAIFSAVLHRSDASERFVSWQPSLLPAQQRYYHARSRSGTSLLLVDRAANKGC